MTANKLLQKLKLSIYGSLYYTCAYTHMIAVNDFKTKHSFYNNC